MENQETQTEVVVEEQATTVTAPAVEAAPAPAAAPAKKKNGIGKGVLVLVFFLLSFIAYEFIMPFLPFLSWAKVPYAIAVVVWFVGYCIKGEKADKIGKIVRTVGVGLMAIYWLLGVYSSLNILFTADLDGEELGWTFIAIRYFVALAMVAVLGLTDWLHKAKSVMNLVGNILMLVLIILNVVTVICCCITVATFMFFDLVGYTFLAFALKIGKSAIIDFRMD